MRVAILFVVCGLAFAQPPDPAYESLSRAYEALNARDYDTAIACFLKGIEAAPDRPSIRKDLGYAYLQVGENLLAREQFRAAMQKDSADTQIAMEYGYLCYETKERREARRVFDRLRKLHVPGAEQAFENVDAPLVSGIARWKQAVEMGADNFSAHFELATVAEERDELDLAAQHYERAWRILPERRSVLVSLGRIWKEMNRLEDAHGALLAAAWGGEPRAAEQARELLPDRYPWVSEFRRALDLDPSNVDLRREFGFLLLKMGLESEGEAEFRILTQIAPGDLLAATQLGFLLNARGETQESQALFERVLAGEDAELANRVRAVLRKPQEPGPETKAPAVDVREMAERSMKAGYLADAAKYLLEAHRLDPGDYSLMLKLGWTFNMLGEDGEAIRWFGEARNSPDRVISADARTAYRRLRSQTRLLRTSLWSYPIYSRRWRNLFGYGQVKTELQVSLPVRPYVGVRFVGDVRSRPNPVEPRYFSESALIPAIGFRTQQWHGAMAWAEAGSAMGYLSGHWLPDYRAGVSYSRGFGVLSAEEANGWFADIAADAVFASRFGNDVLFIQQYRGGYTTALGSSQMQIYMNANLTMDQKRQRWANIIETGPGIRIFGGPLPRSAYFTVNLLEGAYLRQTERYSDFRVGLWYAFTD